LYIDGSKFEANANKYSWVWKKATEKSRYRLFEKITVLLEQINAELACSGMKYVPEYLQEVTKRYTEIWQIDEADFVYGSGHRKSSQQRHYESLQKYTNKSCKNAWKRFLFVGLRETAMQRQSIRQHSCESKRIIWATINFFRPLIMSSSE